MNAFRAAEGLVRRMSANETLAPLAANQAFLLSLSTIPQAAESIDRLVDLLNEGSSGNPVLVLEIKKLVNSQVEALGKSNGDLVTQMRLASLFSHELRLLGSPEASGISASHVSAIRALNQYMQSLANADAAELIDKEIASIQMAIRQPSPEMVSEYLAQHPFMGDLRAQSAGLAIVEFLASQTASAQQAALRAIESVVDQDKVAQMRKTLTEMKETISRRSAMERELFLLRVKNDPVYLSNVAIGLGQAAVGVAVGSPFLILGGLWQGGGERIMAHLPVNRSILVLAQTGARLASLRNREAREELLNQFSQRVQAMPGQALAQVMTCGNAIGAACSRLLDQTGLGSFFGSRRGGSVASTEDVLRAESQADKITTEWVEGFFGDVARRSSGVVRESLSRASGIFGNAFTQAVSVFAGSARSCPQIFD